MMVYEINGHGIYNDKIDDDETRVLVSMVVDTLEFIIDYQTSQLLYVQGYFPLYRAKQMQITIPESKEGLYCFTKIDSAQWEPTLAIAHNYMTYYPNANMIFTIENREYDSKNGIIKWGLDKEENSHIKISENLQVSVNKDNEIECIYIVPDLFR